ncbi:MerR family transcriptional regulator [Kribbella sp. DT2]|uniref:DNA polymerase III subunit beta family protein n=1 Tax=Kribbella sp. DT2 TaxID=3393427 RepID=UPI003CEEC366
MVDDLVSISAFARRVGLTPSALRFYDDCRVLRPAVVDEGNGYRYYAPDQEPRARLLRDLREIDLPLPEVRRVLDGEPSAAAAVVEAHLRTVEQKAVSTRQAAHRILAGLSSTTPRVTLGGPELASAIRQVTPSAATPAPVAAPGASASGAPAPGAPAHQPAGDAERFLPALGCVRIELSETEVTLVATDRYRLAVRKLHPQSFEGTPSAILVPAPALTELSRWLSAADTVDLQAGADLTLTTSTDTRTVPSVDAEYPDYQVILDGQEPAVCRVVADRAALTDLLGTDEVVALSINHQGVTIGDRTIDAITTGDPLGIGFTTRLLAEALAAGVGPDVLLEIHAPDRPVVIRSADQGTFTTLVMPNRL